MKLFDKKDDQDVDANWCHGGKPIDHDRDSNVGANHVIKYV